LAVGATVLARDPFYTRFELLRHGLRRPDGASIRRHLALGLPIGGSILIEVSAFSAMALFIARLGTSAVAGHQVAINLVSLLFMMPIALSNATSTLVAQAVGAGRLAEARRLGWHGLGIGVTLALAVGLAVFAAREPIVRLYTSDAVIVAAALPLLAWVAVFHVADAAQAVAAFVLRAWKIATVPVLIYAAALWGVGLGGGYALAFDTTGQVPPALRGAMGFWVAATAGLIVAALGLVAFLAWVMRRQAALASAPPSPPGAGSGHDSRLVASRVALVVAVAITLTALAGSLLPRVPMPDAPFGDKIVHACGYAALAVAWRLALRRPAVVIGAGVFAFGALIEVLQGLTPWRLFDWADMLANGTGALLGLAALAAATALLRRLRRR
jgi:VanZ family protein